MRKKMKKPRIRQNRIRGEQWLIRGTTRVQPRSRGPFPLCGAALTRPDGRPYHEFRAAAPGRLMHGAPFTGFHQPPALFAKLRAVFFPFPAFGKNHTGVSKRNTRAAYFLHYSSAVPRLSRRLRKNAAVTPGRPGRAVLPERRTAHRACCPPRRRSAGRQHPPCGGLPHKHRPCRNTSPARAS